MRRVKPLRIKPKWVIERDFRVSPAINYQTFSNFGPECIKHPREWSMNWGLLNQPTYHPLTGGQPQQYRPPETSWHWNKYIYGRVSPLKSGCKLNDIVFAWRSCSKRYVLALVAVRCAISATSAFHRSSSSSLILPHSSSIAFEHCLFTSSGRQQPQVDLIAVNCWVIYGTSRLRRLNLLSSPHLWSRSI